MLLDLLLGPGVWIRSSLVYHRWSGDADMSYTLASDVEDPQLSTSSGEGEIEASDEFTVGTIESGTILLVDYNNTGKVHRTRANVAPT